MTLIILAAVFLSVVVITPFGIAYARKTGKLDKPSMRKIHTDTTPSIGWWLLVTEIDSKVLSLTASVDVNNYMK
jgi:UDP-N-acetylmuramyl pentapeptide phosphotransferase/UDP-N-acetylglucosamine-1-phosphate transferase